MDSWNGTTLQEEDSLSLWVQTIDGGNFTGATACVLIEGNTANLPPPVVTP